MFFIRDEQCFPNMYIIQPSRKYFHQTSYELILSSIVIMMGYQISFSRDPLDLNERFYYFPNYCEWTFVFNHLGAHHWNKNRHLCAKFKPAQFSGANISYKMFNIAPNKYSLICTVDNFSLYNKLHNYYNSQYFTPTREKNCVCTTI